MQRVRRLLGGIKAGHTGSLDPLASGMLPICLGEATKLAGEVLAARKAYRFTLQLGQRTATGDVEGAVVESAVVPPLSDTRIAAVLQAFLGDQQQVPPMYSALKRDGQPLYRLARQGLEVERDARRVRIDALELLTRSEQALQLSVLCSKGTYVRVLGEDLARALGSCGHLTALRREYSEPFQGQAMLGLDTLVGLVESGQPWPLLSADRAVPHLPALTVSASAARALRFGQSVPDALPAQRSAGAAVWRLYETARDDGGFMGLGESDDSGVLRVRRLFNATP